MSKIKGKKALLRGKIFLGQIGYPEIKNFVQILKGKQAFVIKKVTLISLNKNRVKQTFSLNVLFFTLNVFVNI